MKSINILYIFLVVLPGLSSCTEKVDNYPAPNAEIHGSVIDVITDKPIQTEEPNGFRIRLIEDGYEDAIPIDFWGKADGTFENSKVFSGTYKVVPIEGAFFPADTQEVNIVGLTEINFKVTPFLAISATISSDSKSIIAKYTIARSKVGYKIVDCKTLISIYPAVSSSVFDKAITHDLSNMDDDAILSTQFIDTVSNLNAGKIYYVRVAARTNNSLNKYNYSSITKISL